MPTYKDRKLQVAYKDGVPQVGYRNGVKVLEAPLPEMYVLTVALNNGFYGLSQIIYGDMLPSKFLGYSWRSFCTAPSSNRKLTCSLTGWSNAYQSNYRQTWIVTRLDTYATAAPTSTSSSLSSFTDTNTDRANDFIKTDEVGDDIPLHIALRCEFDLTLSLVFLDGQQNYIFDSSRGSLVPEFVNDDFQVIEIRTNYATDVITIQLDIKSSGSVPEVLDSSWKLFVWQYDTNDNLLGQATLNWTEITAEDYNLFTADSSRLTSGSTKFVFQIGQYL